MPEPGARCAGVAYRIGATEADSVLRRLDLREQGGYARRTVQVHDARGPWIDRAVTYVATPGNPSYLGPAPLDVVARQVRSAAGPSGSNVEYVLELARALEALGARDDHVDALVARLGGA